MSQLPPGPCSALLTTLGYFRRPYESVDDMYRRYGEPFTTPSLQGPLVVTGAPAGARAIFSADPDTFTSNAEGLVEPLVGRNSVLIMSGTPHKAARRLLQPPFHGARMRAFGALMARIAARRAAAVPVDKPFQMHDLVRDISLDVICEAVLGVSGEARVAETHRAVVDLLGALNPLFIVFKWMQRDLGGYSPWARFVARRRRVQAIVEAEVEARRGAPSERHDILSQLLEARYEDGSPLPSEELFDHLITLLFAGHDTTATALAWALYFLHRHPESRARLHAELDAARAAGGEPHQAYERCRYLEAVCQETLRLRPLIGIVTRRLARPFHLGGYDLPAGIAVGAAASLIHRREDLYPEPERFMPERFLERTYAPHELFPFGGGARRCVGAAFAQYEMKIVLGTLLSAHTFTLLDRDIRPAVRSSTIGLSTRLRMIKQGAAAAAAA